MDVDDVITIDSVVNDLFGLGLNELNPKIPPKTPKMCKTRVCPQNPYTSKQA
jgi:hypothetical protein